VRKREDLLKPATTAHFFFERPAAVLKTIVSPLELRRRAARIEGAYPQRAELIEWRGVDGVKQKAATR